MSADSHSAQRSLRDQACYRAIYDSAGVAIGIATPDGRICEANSTMCSFLGYSEQELLLMTVPQVLHPDNVQGALDKVEGVVSEEGSFVRSLARWVRKDGEIVWGSVWVSAVPGFDRDVDEPRVLVLVEDMTERRKAEEALSDRDRRLKLALEASDNGLWDWDVVSGQVSVSRAWLRSVGYSEHSSLRTVEDWRDAIHPDDVKEASERIFEHLEGRTPYHEIEVRVRTAEGDYIWVEHRGRVVEWDSAGNPLRAMGTVRDITTRRRVEGALRRSEARYRGMMESQVDLVARTDLEGRLVFVNGAFCKKFGKRRSELLGGRFLPFVVAEDREETNAAYAELQKPPHRVMFEHRAETAEGLRWLAWELVGIVGEHGYVIEYQSVGRDVTEYRNALAALEIAKDEAEAANRSKSEFLANMSHEIRTPMTSILGFAELADDREIGAEERRQHLDKIRRNGEHLLAIINDILDLSKVESGQMEVLPTPCSVVEVVEDLCEMLAPRAAEGGIRLRIAYESALPVRVRTDPVRLRQVLLNLVGNAIKFTPQGEVVVGLRYVPAQSSRFGSLDIAVRDTGIGIGPEHLARLFAPFSQGDESMTRRYGGTGLGLTISKRLAMILGGDILVTSEEGRGSEFLLRLMVEEELGVPLVTMEAAGRARRPKAPPESLGNRKLVGRILIADDGDDNRLLYSLLLRRWGLEVDEAENGREAVEHWQREGNEGYDLILMDLQMPEMDGYEATRRLRDQGCLVPVLALSAHAMEGRARADPRGGLRRLREQADRQRRAVPNPEGLRPGGLNYS